MVVVPDRAPAAVVAALVADKEAMMGRYWTGHGPDTPWLAPQRQRLGKAALQVLEVLERYPDVGFYRDDLRRMARLWTNGALETAIAQLARAGRITSFPSARLTAQGRARRMYRLADDQVAERH